MTETTGRRPPVHKNGHSHRTRSRVTAATGPSPAWRDIVAPAASRVNANLAGSGVGAAAARLAGALPSPRIPTARDLRRLQRRLPAQAMGATGTLAWKLRELTGRDVIDLESLQDLMAMAFRISMVRSAHRAGEYEVDDFGFEDQWAEIWLPLARLIYRKYWRVETDGVENVPRHGGALLVSNHAGVFPWDGAMIKVAVHEGVNDRHVRALVARWLMETPGLSWFMRRTGQTLGHPDDSQRLLTRGELVLVFPEGVQGTGKPFSERYRLRRFGRGGFVEAALRARVPIVPVSVMGSEETYPMLGDVAPLARLIKAPYFPVTPTLPWLGPLGLIPLPSKWRIRFHEPVRTDEMEAGAALDRGRILAVSDQVRDTIQDGVIDLLRDRRTVFGG